MYEKPHDNLMGTKFSYYDPTQGISISSITLNDPRSHYADYIASACFLAYRCLDGKYEDKKYVWECLSEASSLLEKIADKEKIWFVNRWRSSLLIARVYMKMCCFGENVPVEDLKMLANSNYSILYPPQIVNVLRANSLLILNYLVDNDHVFADKQIYQKAIPIFGKSISAYDTKNASDEKINAAVQISEASEIMSFILKMRNSFLKSEKNISWIEQHILDKIDERFKEPYYKSMQIIFNKTKKL